MLFEKQRQGAQKASIRYIIFIYFTLTALAASVFIGISLYTRLSGQMADTIPYDFFYIRIPFSARRTLD